MEENDPCFDTCHETDAYEQPSLTLADSYDFYIIILF